MFRKWLVPSIWIILFGCVTVACTGSGMVVSSRPRVACTDLRDAPHSRWRTTVEAGVHWLLTPCGERFFSVGVNVIDGGEPQRFSNGRIAYNWATFYSDLEDWARTTRQRVLAWGFNTAGGWSLHPTILGLPITPDLELGRSARFHWFDPFDPATTEQMHSWAHRLVTPYKGNPYRIGYFIDNEVGWWNGALFLYFLKQPATNYTKQQLIARLSEHYGNNWERFTQDFVPPQGTGSFDQLLHHTDPTQLRAGGAGIQFVRKWTGIITALYYRLAHDAIRAADPDALIFGDRLPIYYDPVAVRTMVQHVDVISTNYNIDSPDGWLARYFFDGLRQLAPDKPILISEWFFAADENRSGNINNGHLMTVPTQAQRTRGAIAAAQRFARVPEIVGVHWFQYYDHPNGGREDGEDYNFGLVDINDRPYERLVETFSRINPRLADLHQRQLETAVRNRPRPWQIPYAAIDAQDRSLEEWPKEQALIAPLTAPKPEIPFGDFYVAWSSDGLHLAMIAMDYYDSDLLAYDGDEFPLQEAFRIDWGVDAGGGARRFTLYIVPPRVFPESGAPMMRPWLCVADRVSCQPVPGAVTTYFGSDQPRITVEVALPWPALGLTEAPAQRSLRLELAATAWHRSRWMSSSGLPPVQAMQDPSQWRPVRLAGY